MRYLNILFIFRFILMSSTTRATTTTNDEYLSDIGLILGEGLDDNCENICQELYENVKGIISCNLINDTNRILICYNRNIINEKEILLSIKGFGYSFDLIDNEIVQTQLRIEGMHCNSCVSNICDTVMDLNGIIHIELTFLDKLATITYDPILIQLDEIIHEIEKLSFQVAISNASSIKTKNEKNLDFLVRHPLETIGDLF